MSLMSYRKPVGILQAGGMLKELVINHVCEQLSTVEKFMTTERAGGVLGQLGCVGGEVVLTEWFGVIGHE